MNHRKVILGNPHRPVDRVTSVYKFKKRGTKMGNKDEINVLEHGLVPEHKLVPKEEEKGILEKLGLKRENLPKIRKSDPALRELEKVHGDINVGRMIEVKRKSRTADSAKAYRLVVKRD